MRMWLLSAEVGWSLEVSASASWTSLVRMSGSSMTMTSLLTSVVASLGSCTPGSSHGVMSSVVLG